MARAAQRWADRGVFEHASGAEDSYNLAPPEGPAGENLGMGHSSIEAVVTAWYSEVQNCGPFPGCNRGKTGVVGHFTPMVWRGVTQIGCAIGPRKIYVCRYKAGDTLTIDTPNMAGGYASNVLAALKSEAQCEASAAPDPGPPMPPAPPPVYCGRYAGTKPSCAACTGECPS